MKHERIASTPPAKKWHEERRRTVRVPVDLVGAYTIGESRPVIARIAELSNTSFRLIASAPLAIDTAITIAFPPGALASKTGRPRVHVFHGRIVHAAAAGVHHLYGIDLVENIENVDDLRWTVLQLSLRRTARGLKARGGSATMTQRPLDS